MRFTGVKELKHKTMDILKASKKGDVIITAYGKPTAVLHHITEDDFADYLIENDPAFKMKIEESYAEYKTHSGITANAMLKKLKKQRGTKKL